jgi:hypothetical protein
LVFEKNANFCRKLAKIAYHNIDPRDFWESNHQNKYITDSQKGSASVAIVNQGLIFCTFFTGKITRKIFPEKMLGKNGIFRRKRFEKLFFFPRNSTEFSAESDFPLKKMYEKLATGVEFMKPLLSKFGLNLIWSNLSFYIGIISSKITEP